ncbi:NUDIX hydrolase [Paenibacillus sp. ISL-20]|uniref:NUDIX domain-containing protein n=1 Tax=Paenibacillus sp. ISL-20 TaxID=2819163 RepID=UPI001BEB27C6|nr:NUDIX hydrolase [Paenibacillus sp. ISL-20]MBT2760475.1 NUDIX hydrolase [Paenibacillus sp. ISL-20]
MSWRSKYAYGGIVFNQNQEVLMRSPSGHWGGYVWTFAKGGAELSDNSPEETATREVLEETGYKCSIIAAIPGEYESDTCVTKYFLMSPEGWSAHYDEETQEIKWVSVEQAFEMIEMTSTQKGKQRDKDALISAIHTMRALIIENRF